MLCLNAKLHENYDTDKRTYPYFNYTSNIRMEISPECNVSI